MQAVDRIETASENETAYLDELNPAQRAAVTFGVTPRAQGERGARSAPPLLVIAGAGSGKTKTLAHRVANVAHSSVLSPSELRRSVAC